LETSIVFIRGGLLEFNLLELFIDKLFLLEFFLGPTPGYSVYCKGPYCEYFCALLFTFLEGTLLWSLLLLKSALEFYSFIPICVYYFSSG
jgi:hypothetical protein